MKCELLLICGYVNETIATSELSKFNYISTENMLPNKNGIEPASSLPNQKVVKAFKKGDILISNIRPYFKKIWLAEYNGGCSNDVLVIRAKKGTNKEFLYYLLSENKFFDYVTASSKGTKMPRGDKNAIMNYLVPEFEEKEQRKIAKLLGTIDKKIKVNKKINDNLENFIKNLFKDTFYNNKSNFSYKKISLGDLMDYQGGSQPPSSEFINYKRNGYIRFIQIRDYDSNSHITYIPISSKNKICNEKDIMIARYGAALGKICCGLNGAYNVALAKVIPRKSFYREFLRNYLSSKEFYIGINNKGERSAQSGFNKSDIKSFELLFPKDEKIVIKFEKIASNCFELYLKNLKQNRTLENIRNKLLPYLISGKIDISDIELRH